MLILLGFALLAGAGTALSPCVLPVLPALLSAGGVGGRRRPLGIVLGLSITFTVTIVGLAMVVDGVGLGNDPLRDIAVVVLLLAGVALLVPRVAERIEAPLSRLSRFGPRGRGDGFFSGLLVGGALGFVYTPCASPILAAVISVSAATSRTIFVAIAYAVGSAVVLLLLTLGGRRLFDRIRRAGRGHTLQRALGAVMVLTAVAILANLDVVFDQFIAKTVPNVNLTASLECSSTITSRLHEIDGHKEKFVPANGSSSCSGSASSVHVLAKGASQAKLLETAEQLPVLGTAPNFTDTEKWFNTPGGRPLSIASLKGRVVLIDFWTYTCINCIRTLPHVKALNAAYGSHGLTIVGVETPEFAFERDATNVAEALKQFGLRYPVVQDNEMGTWNAYGNEAWPADYLIDAKGNVRYASIGEGNYSQTETAIRALLAEAGYHVGKHSRSVASTVSANEEITPETYTGTARAEGWVDGPVPGTHDYGTGGLASTGKLTLNEFAYTGTWTIGGQPATAVSDAGIEAKFRAKDLYLVLSPPAHGTGHLTVDLDGKPIPAKYAGADVHDGSVTVAHQRLYSLVSLPSDQRHRLTLSLSPGTVAYDFTFG